MFHRLIMSPFSKFAIPKCSLQTIKSAHFMVEQFKAAHRDRNQTKSRLSERCSLSRKQEVDLRMIQWREVKRGGRALSYPCSTGCTAPVVVGPIVIAGLALMSRHYPWMQLVQGRKRSGQQPPANKVDFGCCNGHWTQSCSGRVEPKLIEDSS